MVHVSDTRVLGAHMMEMGCVAWTAMHDQQFMLDYLIRLFCYRPKLTACPKHVPVHSALQDHHSVNADLGCWIQIASLGVKECT